jgi:glycosyltransferase involved in cell wall biosynthesis
MRILFAADVLPDPNSGAAGTELQTIAGLRRLGHEVDEVWATDLGRRIKHGNLHYLLELPYIYRKVIRQKYLEKAYDVVHANQGHCYLAAKEHRESRRPGIFVCRSHGLDDHMEMVLKEWRYKLGIKNRSLIKSIPGKIVDTLLFRHDRLAARYASGVIVSNSLDREFLINHHNVPRERVACIHQAPPDLFLQTLPVKLTPERLKRILYIGGFGYWKSPHIVAEVVNELICENPKVNFTWVCGKADHQKVTQLLTYSARKHINLVSWISQEELLNIYDKNGIFIYPSLFDGFGKVFLEAMARGLCVIATRTGGMRDIIRDGKNGFHVDFNNSSMILQKIHYLQDNIEKAEYISCQSRSAAEDMTWDRVARETASFYKKLLVSNCNNQLNSFI